MVGWGDGPAEESGNEVRHFRVNRLPEPRPMQPGLPRGRRTKIDGRTDGQTDGQTDRRTDGQTQRP